MLTSAHPRRHVLIASALICCAMGISLLLAHTHEWNTPLLSSVVAVPMLRNLVIGMLIVGLAGIGILFVLGHLIVETITRPNSRVPFVPLTPEALDLPAEVVTFPAQGEAYEVHGLYLPRPGASATILLCPGFRRPLTDVLVIAKHLWAAGHQVLVFEHYGHGASIGTRVTLGYREVDDVLGAVAYAKRRAPTTRVGAIGYSMGAATVIMAAARTPSLEAVVADSSFATLWSAIEVALRSTLRCSLPSWVIGGLYHVTDWLLWWRMGYRLSHVEPLREIARLAPRPLLLIHGLGDTVVDPRDAFRLYEAAAEPKTLWLLPATAHIRGYFSHPAVYTTKILAFFERHLCADVSDTPVQRNHCRGLPHEEPPGHHSDDGVPEHLPMLRHREPSSSSHPSPQLQQISGAMHASSRDALRRRRWRRSIWLRYGRPAQRDALERNRRHRLGLAYGRLIYRARWAVLLVWVVALLISLPFASHLAAVLHNQGYVIADSESNQVETILRDQLHQPVARVFVVFHADRVAVHTPRYRQQVQAFLSRVLAVPHLMRATQGGSGLDGTTTFVTLDFDTDQDAVTQLLPGVRALLPAGLQQPAHVFLTGTPAITSDLQIATQQDSEHAEQVALPITLLLLLVVFGSVVAGTIPLVLALVAIPVTSALIYGVAVHIETNVFVLNIASVLGLGLSIDYSLLLVRRFREELRPAVSVREAVARTMATAGEAVLLSGLTVIVGFAGLFCVGIPVMGSFALGGITIAATAVLAAMTLLPALSSLLGRRINALPLPVGRWFHRRSTDNGRQRQQKHFWQRWAHMIMRRPVLMILVVTGVLVGLGWPALSLRPGLPGVSALPLDAQARQGLEILTAQFPQMQHDPIVVVAQTPGPTLLTTTNLERLQSLAQQIARLPHVTTVTDLLTPPDGLSPERWGSLLRSGAFQRVPQLRQAVAMTTQGQTSLLLVQANAQTNSPQENSLIDRMRALNAQPHLGVHVLVGGSSALALDFTRELYGHFIWAFLFILLATYLLLLIMFRSLLLPLKAIVMNLLSIGASYGALVFVFQQGDGQQLLHVSPDGSIDRFVPVLLFCVLFGLSMDYEVFLLARIQEEWQRCGENRLAVARGLERTGGIITQAALLFMIVSAAFLTTSLVVTKELGLGLTVAILVDASIIRVILVPATMSLMGRWNWWFPTRRKPSQQFIAKRLVNDRRPGGRVLRRRQQNLTGPSFSPQGMRTL